MRKARRPAYPPLPGLALALASCQATGQPAQTPQAPPPEPAAVIASEGSVLVIARDPDSPEPEPPQPLPPQPAFTDSGRIEDPLAHREPVACPGDCPAAFRSTGPAVDLEYRVTDGSIPNARASLIAIQPSLRACLQGWQPGRTPLRARVSISARVRDDGSIGPMDVRVAGGADSELTTCVANRIRGMRFRAPGAPATLRLVVELNRD